MEMTMAETEVNGINIHYRMRGEGEPLLLIMGLAANADWWDEDFLQRLAERYQVVTFDNRGAGRSDKPEGPYLIPLMASDTVGLMDHLGWESANILGASMGGMIAQEIACTYPDRVRRLVLMCTNCGGKEQVLAGPEVFAALSMPREELSDEEIAKASLGLLFPKEYIESNLKLMEEEIEMMLTAPIEPRCFEAQIAGMRQWSIYPRLCELNKPTMIITGGQDILIPPENSRILADAIQNSRLVEIPEAAHKIATMFPQEVARAVLNFLAED
jgi:3-oxoadipate enol-lactonase